MKTLKQYCDVAREYLSAFCKNILKKYLLGKCRYVIRAALALAVSFYLFFLLRDFTTIPVRDYYFDFYSASYDSIVPDIRVVVGNTNVFNTYSDAFDSQGDSVSIKYNLYPHSPSYKRKYRIAEIDTEKVQHHTYVYMNENGKQVAEKEVLDTLITREYKPWPTFTAETIGLIMDSVCRLAQQDERYAPFLNTYEYDKQLQFCEKETLHSSYVYMQAYLHCYSSVPVGYHHGSKVMDGDSAYFGSSDKFNVIWDVFPTSKGKTGIADTLFYRQLSQNHSYWSHNMLWVTPYAPSTKECTMSVRSHNTFVRDTKLNRLFPRINLTLLRENIALQEYRFCVHPNDIDAYKITLHTRGGAVIQNNPSDELQVLNLHDTRITKRRNSENNMTSEEFNDGDENFYNADVFVSIPENDGLQYIRLFFVTLLIGWLLLSFFKNIIRFIRKSLIPKEIESYKVDIDSF